MIYWKVDQLLHDIEFKSKVQYIHTKFDADDYYHATFSQMKLWFENIFTQPFLFTALPLIAQISKVIKSYNI